MSIPSTIAPQHAAVGSSERSYVRMIENWIGQLPECAFYFNHLRHYLESGAQSAVQPIVSLNLSGSLDTQQNRAESTVTGSAAASAKLLVLAGFVSPQAINLLGSQYHLRPELFLGHLEIERITIHDQTSFELPAAPSNRNNIIHVRLIRLGRSETELLSTGSITTQRKKIENLCKQYEKGLFDLKKYGATRFRKVNVHSRRYFSVEQVVTFCVTESSKSSWTGKLDVPVCDFQLIQSSGLFLLDRGGSLHGEGSLPWADFGSRSDRPPSFLPTVSYNKECDTKTTSLAPGHRIPPENYMLHPYHPLDDHIPETDHVLLRDDPFFILSRLYRTAISSWTQILNFLENNNLEWQNAALQDFTVAVDELRYNINFLDHICKHLEIDQATIGDRGSREWPQTAPDLQERINDIQIALLEDYKWLINRTQGLARRYETTISVLVSAAGVLEAQKSIRQAKQVALLTQLAFFFIPISVISSVFGMNVMEINGSTPRLRMFFLTAIPISVLAVLLSQFETLRWMQSLAEKFLRCVALKLFYEGRRRTI